MSSESLQPDLDPEAARRALLSVAVRQELHHLLWTPPFDYEGERDAGWFCRDHALLVACLGRMLGLPVDLARGQAAFVQGPLGESPGVAFVARNHTFNLLRVDAVRMEVLDLSARLTDVELPGWRAWELDYVCGSPRPVGDLRVVGDDGAFGACVARAATGGETPTACYQIAAIREVDQSLLDGAVSWIDSALSRDLAANFDRSAYAYAVLHLYDLATGQGGSLRDRSRQEAWATLVGRSAVRRVAERAHLRGAP